MKDNMIKLPENGGSGNKVPDILDEMRWGTDWVLSMQRKDGGVFFRCQCKGVTEQASPEIHYLIKTRRMKPAFDI